MKQSIIFTILTFLSAIAMNAQSPQFSIFDSFEQRPKTGEGTVVVHQSEPVKQMVGTRIDNDNIIVTDGKTYLKTRGYRIQAYSGNQRTSRADADELATRIKEFFPKLDTYTKYSAPFWRLHVGNYLTYEEAFIMNLELQKTFPQRKNEIFILEDDIQLPLY